MTSTWHADVVGFFYFLSAAGGKSYLVWLAACERGRESRRGGRRGVAEGSGERATMLFTRTMKDVCRRCTRETAARGDKLLEFIRTAPFLRGPPRAFHPPSVFKNRASPAQQRRAGLPRRAPGSLFRSPPGISRPRLSIINLRRQCLQRPSVTSSPGIPPRPRSIQDRFCRLRPKVYEAFTAVWRLSPLFREQRSRFRRGKHCCRTVCPVA